MWLTNKSRRASEHMALGDDTVECLPFPLARIAPLTPLDAIVVSHVARHTSNLSHNTIKHQTTFLPSFSLLTI